MQMHCERIDFEDLNEELERMRCVTSPSTVARFFAYRVLTWHIELAKHQLECAFQLQELWPSVASKFGVDMRLSAAALPISVDGWIKQLLTFRDRFMNYHEAKRLIEAASNYAGSKSIITSQTGE